MSFTNIAVLGLGNVGRLVARLLHESGFSVTAFDSLPGEANQPFERRILDVSNKDDLAEALAACEAVISCLPYHLNAAVAAAAHAHDLNYFDLTEDVTVTKTVRELAKTSKGVMAPQCGLAPGYIGIIGAHLAERFETLRAIKLRVGALPQHPTLSNPLPVRRARTFSPSSHCSAHTLSKPWASVSFIASRNLTSASVGMVA